MLALLKTPPTRTRRRHESPAVELSDRRFNRAMAAIEALAPAVGRLSARLRTRGAVTMLPFAKGLMGHKRTVEVYDLSASGVAIVDHQPVAIGTQFKLLIPRRLRRPVEMLCVVRHCRRSEDAYIIGAEFGVSWLETLGTLVGPPLRLAA